MRIMFESKKAIALLNMHSFVFSWLGSLLSHITHLALTTTGTYRLFPCQKALVYSTSTLLLLALADLSFASLTYSG